MMNDSLRGYKILIAEDEVINYAYIEAILMNKGVEFLWATNGNEVLELISRPGNVNLILMDVNMPGMDGITATRYLREKQIDIPVIFLSAVSDPNVINSCYKAGGNEYIIKPIRIGKLEEILEKYLLNV